MEERTGGPRSGGDHANVAERIDSFLGSTRKNVKNIPFNPKSNPWSTCPEAHIHVHSGLAWVAALWWAW